MQIAAIFRRQLGTCSSPSQADLPAACARALPQALPDSEVVQRLAKCTEAHHQESESASPTAASGRPREVIVDQSYYRHSWHWPGPRARPFAGPGSDGRWKGRQYGRH